MNQPVAKCIVNRRPMQSNNKDPRLRALYEVMQESRQIADAAEEDYLFYQEAKRYANELLQWMRSSGYALVYDGMWKVAGFEHLQAQPTFYEALLSAWNARQSVSPASRPEITVHL